METTLRILNKLHDRNSFAVVLDSSYKLPVVAKRKLLAVFEKVLAMYGDQFSVPAFVFVKHFNGRLSY